MDEDLRRRSEDLRMHWEEKRERHKLRYPGLFDDRAGEVSMGGILDGLNLLMGG